MAVQTVRVRINDEAARAEIQKLVLAVPGYGIENNDHGACDLLIFELTDKDTDAQFDAIREAMSSGKAGHVFLVSSVLDPNVLIQALKVGAKEFFRLPLNGQDVKGALIKFQARQALRGQKGQD